METLFGNMEEIADVSQRLLIKLEDALAKHDLDHQLIGKMKKNILKCSVLWKL